MSPCAMVLTMLTVTAATVLLRDERCICYFSGEDRTPVADASSRWWDKLARALLAPRYDVEDADKHVKHRHHRLFKARLWTCIRSRLTYTFCTATPP